MSPRSDAGFSEAMLPASLAPNTIAAMANTYSALYFHIVFSTKNREPWLKADPAPRVWEILGGIARDHRMTPIQIGGFDDHVHALVSSPPALAVSKAVQYLKGVSSKWIHEEMRGFKAFAWQDGYGAFTVSKSQIASVVNYIRDQRNHHAKLSFQDEFRAMLQKHDLEFDERYVWG